MSFSSESVKIENVSSEFNKLNEKIANFGKVNKNLDLDSALAELQDLQQIFQNSSETDALSEEQKTALQSHILQLKDKLSEIVKIHRDIHATISKFGKCIDKHFMDDLVTLNQHFEKSPTASDYTETKKTELLNCLVLEHLLRQGYEEAAEKLIIDSGVSRDSIDYEHFLKICHLVSSIRRGDLEPAKNWLSHRPRNERISRLDYLLSKLEFLEGVWKQSDDSQTIIHLARRLGPFQKEYTSDFHRLMGSLVYLKRGLESSPYSSLSASGYDQQETVTEACLLVSRDICLENNVSGDSPISTAFTSGCRALPRLHNLQKAMACLAKYGTESNILPVAVDVDPSAHHHNIFHCPIIKEVAVGHNYPVRLMCGHAICKDAFNMLSSSDRGRVKCPYCPMDTRIEQVQQIKF